MAYNSSHTGAQIDAAISAVRQKESNWDGKQDALVGSNGQIVVFNAEGKPVAGDMPSSGFEIGDILLTTRTDLGEDWLLCNGETISINDYPNLVGLLPGGIFPMTKVKDLGMEARDLVYNGEYYVYHTGDVVVHSSPTLTGTYTNRGSTPDYQTIRALDGDPNHYWFARYDNDREFAYAESDFTGGWKYNSPVSTTANDNGYMDYYGEGYYVCRVSLYSYDVNYYATSPSASRSSWTKIPNPYRIVGFANGYWFRASRDGNDWGQLTYNTNITASTWNRVNGIPTDINGYAIYRLNGRYIIICGSLGIYFGTSLSNFTKINLPSDFNTDSMDAYNGVKVYYGNGLYSFYAKDNCVYITDELKANPDWTKVESEVLGSSGGTITELQYLDEKWVMLTNNAIYTADTLLGLKLPSISIDGIHAYIKAQ